MTQDPSVANDVYERFGLEWVGFPKLVTPSAHSDEAELFCAKQSLAVYAVYPNTPHAPAHDYIPSRERDAITAGTIELRRMIEDGTDGPAPSFEAERGYRIVTSDQASALLVWSQHYLVIAFRGTANWQDWIHNFTGGTISTELIEQRGIVKLHKGFTGLAENIAPAVIELIYEFLEMANKQNSLPTVTLCGHSLGGALALNFASKFERMYDHEYHLFKYGRLKLRLGATYTFGAPRIGKGQVWSFIHRPHYRLIVRGDPVPLTPPGCSSDFQATYLENPTQPAIQPTSTFGKIKKAALTIFSKLGFNPSAHDIETYIEAIEMKIAAKQHQ